jgi:ribonuclease T2
MRFLIAIFCGFLNFSAFAQAERMGDRPGSFDFYVLALSWSPSYCARAGSSRSSEQCETGKNPGFVVHGLWPQHQRGYPARCAGPNPTMPRAAREEAQEIFPDPGLAAHQWRKHGTCSGESPSGYLARVKSARDRVTIPPDLVAPMRDRILSAVEIERAFMAVNPGLRSEMIGVDCQQGNVLKEVRVCLTRDLRQFEACEEVDRRACHARSITIPAQMTRNP